MTLPNGYEMTTTFWMDFSIADAFGANAVKDTFNRAFNEWKSNHVYLTELVITLNLKNQQHFAKNGRCELSRLYNELWEQADNYACENLKGEELNFFYRITD